MIPIRGLRAPVTRLPPLEPPHTSAARVGPVRCLWTLDKDEELKRRWSAGQSGAVIAEALGGGLSRCAILARARRLRLEPRQSPIAKGELWG